MQITFFGFEIRFIPRGLQRRFRALREAEGPLRALWALRGAKKDPYRGQELPKTHIWPFRVHVGPYGPKIGVAGFALT